MIDPAEEALAIGRLVDRLSRHLGDPERYSVASSEISKRLSLLAKTLRASPDAAPTTVWRPPSREAELAAADRRLREHLRKRGVEC